MRRRVPGFCAGQPGTTEDRGGRGLGYADLYGAQRRVWKSWADRRADGSGSPGLGARLAAQAFRGAAVPAVDRPAPVVGLGTR